MTFATDLAKVPFTATQQNAVGFLPPLMRAAGHLLFVLADCAVAEGDTRPLTDDEVAGELKHAKEHWDAIVLDEALSAGTRETLGFIGKCITSANKEFGTWDRDAKIRNLRDLGNRIAGVTATLDRELVGLRGSDPGLTL